MSANLIQSISYSNDGFNLNTTTVVILGHKKSRVISSAFYLFEKYKNYFSNFNNLSTDNLPGPKEKIASNVKNHHPAGFHQ